MDRLWILKRAEELRLTDSLDIDDVRLFFLLLAHCKEAGDGRIDCNVIRRVLGPEFTAGRLETICRNLHGKGLIEVSSPSPEGAKGYSNRLVYKIAHS